MDELVERCWEKLASLRGCDPMDALIIDRDDLAAIIPIVRDWQRERDAGIARTHMIPVDESDDKHADGAYNAACHHIATAIRNQEQTDGRD